MKIVTATPTAWDSYLTTRESGHFLQSWAWGDFQEKLGNKIWRLAVEDNGDIVAQILVIKLSLGFGQSILYSPRGSIIDKSQSLATAQTSGILLLEQIKTIAEAEKVVCYRIDPQAEVDELSIERFYLSQGFIKNPKSIQPKHSSVLNLTHDPDQLLNQMKSKTRYNIHLAQKHGIDIVKSSRPEEIQDFLNLTHATSSRQGFAPHSDRYYKTQFDVLNTSGIQDLWLAKRGQTTIAAILVNSYGSTATYVHGASDNQYRELMAPYLIQFSAIKDAYTNGLKYYDFWGIHPEPNHPWAGFTRFKRGFGGRDVEYIGTLELPVNRLLYKLYRLISRFR